MRAAGRRGLVNLAFTTSGIAEAALSMWRARAAIIVRFRPKDDSMSRARLFDLRYEHEVRAAPSEIAVQTQPPQHGHSLVARLRGLKALMDAERDSLAAWMVAPQTLFS